MKCFVVDTPLGVFAFDESGTIVNYFSSIGKIKEIEALYYQIEKSILIEKYETIISELIKAGYNVFIYDNKELEELSRSKLDINTSFEPNSIEIRSFRQNILTKLGDIGLKINQDELVNTYKRLSENIVKNKIRKYNSQLDLIITQVVESLDNIKKTLSLFSMRLREWYAMHFPELTDDIVIDDLLFADIVNTLGKRSNFSKKALIEKFNLESITSNKIMESIIDSMGADIDVSIIQEFSSEIISLNKFRENLEEYLDNLMQEVAPNIRSVIGSLIGGKLITKAGNLKKLAYMPASRIQLLGAEKALYRFLRKGDNIPKHGLIFQWNQIRSSQPKIRGKIARLVAGKIGIAAKVDYFSGDFVGEDLANEIQEKINTIKERN